MKKLNLVVLLITFASCKTTQPTVIYITKDSVITKTEYVIKDSIITIPGDTIRFQVPCDKDTVFITRSKSSSSMVQIHKGIVTVQNNCDEKDLIISKLQAKLSHYEASVSDSSRIEIKTVKVVPTAYKVYAWGFWILGIALAATLYFKQNLWVILAGSMVKIAKVFKKK
jgi:hypothetical protein